MAHARFFNGSTEGQPLDAYLGDRMMASNLGHGNFTEYQEIEPGDYPLSVYYSGMYNNPIYSTSVNIPLGGIYSYGLSGLCPSMSLLPITDSCNLSAGSIPW